ncbi:hypothetical protein PspLS_05165 [Pyricularia sp. CBS 133598]|nr:hypothetical protein PspLS_05165 [Pyricularia sp. CBS 133598]
MIDQVYPDLEDLWHEKDPSVLWFFVCGRQFESEALVRTFRVFDGNNECGGGSRTIISPLGGTLVLYERHFGCLQNENIRYVTVLHVWNTEVFATQNKDRHTPQDDHVRRRVFESPANIAQSISRGVEGVFEVWHNYESVPQVSLSCWHHGVRVATHLWSVFIISLYVVDAGTQDRHSQDHTQGLQRSVAMTIRHFDDVTPAMIESFFHGETDEKRMEGMLGICNSKRCSRVWTAMEYIRSREVAKNGSTHGLEARVKIGGSIMPWNLGPLTRSRSPQDRSFGVAFALLSRRGCQSRFDFLYALQGIVEGSSETSGLMQQHGSWEERYRGCPGQDKPQRALGLAREGGGERVLHVLRRSRNAWPGRHLAL